MCLMEHVPDDPFSKLNRPCPLSCTAFGFVFKSSWNYICAPMSIGVVWSEWIVADWSGLACTGVDWSGLEWIGVDWSGLECIRVWGRIRVDPSSAFIANWWRKAYWRRPERDPWLRRWRTWSVWERWSRPRPGTASCCRPRRCWDSRSTRRLLGRRKWSTFVQETTIPRALCVERPWKGKRLVTPLNGGR